MNEVYKYKYAAIMTMETYRGFYQIWKKLKDDPRKLTYSKWVWRREKVPLGFDKLEYGSVFVIRNSYWAQQIYFFFLRVHVSIVKT